MQIHKHHIQMFFQQYVFFYEFQCYFCLRTDSQISHSNSFSPVCVLLWITMLLLNINADLQTSHSDGFSSVCILLWHVKPFLVVKQIQKHHFLNCFSPVCILLWHVKQCLVVNEDQISKRLHHSLIKMTSSY